MRPRDLPFEVILPVEAFARRLGLEPAEYWAIAFGAKPKPPGWDAAFADAFEPLLTSAPYAAKYKQRGQVEQAIDIRKIRKVGRPLNTDHPFTRALAEDNITVSEWAEGHKVSRAQVKGWFANGDGGRGIPRAMADLIEREFTPKGSKTSRVPATIKTWKNGIR